MKIRLKKYICAALASLGIVTTGCNSSRMVWNNEEEYYNLPYWSQRVKSFRKLNYDPGTCTLFIGDSITEGFDLQRMFNDHLIVNMGIGGDFTSGVLRRLDEVKRLQPCRIFVMVGINDILKGVPEEVVQQRYAQIIDTIRTESPGAVLYVQSVLPVAEIGMNAATNYTIMQKVQRLNSFISTKAEKTGAHFIDLHSHFLEDGILGKKYTYDGLHISDAGYTLWTSLVLPYAKP